MALAIFYAPPIDGISLRTVPLAYLHLATPLAGTRHRLTLVDGRIEPDPLATLSEHLTEADALFVSAMPGSQIANGLAACAHARSLRPEIPIVWGGAHPSVDPAGTLESDLVTAVVAGRGEFTVEALLDAIEGEAELSDVANVWSRDAGGEIRRGPCEPFHRRLPNPPDFGLLDSVEPYVCQTRRSSRMLDYISSFGCPHRCTFCSEPLTSKSVWSAMPADVLVDAVERLVGDHDLDGILFEDAKFSARPQRLIAFCEGLLERGLDIHWIATACSTDLDVFHRRGVLELMRRAGCEQLFIGAEAASPTTLAKYKKVVDGSGSYRLARLLWEDYEILPHFSYVLGHPVETLDQLQETLDLHEAVCELVGAPTGELGLYNPVLGSAFLDANEDHFLVPDTLEGWSRFSYQTQALHRRPSKELTRKLFQHHVKMRRKFPNVEAHQTFDVWQEQYLTPRVGVGGAGGPRETASASSAAS